MAMGRGGNQSANATANSETFRTPDRTDPSVISPTQFCAGTPTSSTSASRSWKKNPTRNVRDQTTLTQIDFVTKLQNLESEDDLDYIRRPQNAREVINIDDDQKSLDHDIHSRSLSASRGNHTRGVRFREDAESSAPSRQKRSSSHNRDDLKNGRRKSGENIRVNKKDKSLGKKARNKTLTQMDYVRRYLKVPDEDVNLEYTYITPPKNLESQTLPHERSKEMQSDQDLFGDDSSHHKKRKLLLDPGSSGKTKHLEAQEEEGPELPVTPRKTRGPEIPSSQSPESPGLTVITSSQFRSATESSRKRVSPSIEYSHMKEESPELGSFQRAESPPLAQTTLKKTNRSSSPLQRTVVYETDAETDYGDFQDDLPILPNSPHHQVTDNCGDQVANVEDDPDSVNADSQELPPIPFFKEDIEPGPLLPEGNLMSDASICYQRLQPATQFPLGPVPTINTQKMAELFPDDPDGLHIMATAPLSSPSMKAPPVPESQLATQSQPQLQSQDLDKAATDIVPESSPLTQHAKVNLRGPESRDVVVQVESSQPADRLHKPGLAGQDSGPQGILSRSQILTSSVMESIPFPAFWMSSQDSIGEPYSLPDT